MPVQLIEDHFKHCTFLNYSGVDSYSGSNAVRIIDCAFEASNRLSDVVLLN